VGKWHKANAPRIVGTVLLENRSPQMTQLFILGNATARNNALRAVTDAPDGFQIRIGEPKRNLEQSARFHAVCEDLANSSATWAGKPRNATEWKTLLISGHTIATKGEVEIIPGLEGEFLNVRESSARMPKSRMTSLIEYSEAFCATHA
jgi:hypothetical protein